MKMRPTMLKSINLMMVAAFLAITLTIVGTSNIASIRHVAAQASNSKNTSAPATGQNANTSAATGQNTNTSAATRQNLTSSVPITSSIAQVIASKVRISLSNATTSAEKAVGTNSHAVSANLRAANGFLVYAVSVADSSYNFHRVLVDPGNGKVLSNSAMQPGTIGIKGFGLPGTTSGPRMGPMGPTAFPGHGHGLRR
jgi:uncharacterized membrane protein YkoI